MLFPPLLALIVLSFSNNSEVISLAAQRGFAVAKGQSGNVIKRAQSRHPGSHVRLAAAQATVGESACERGLKVTAVAKARPSVHMTQARANTCACKLRITHSKLRAPSR